MQTVYSLFFLAALAAPTPVPDIGGEAVSTTMSSADGKSLSNLELPGFANAPEKLPALIADYRQQLSQTDKKKKPREWGDLQKKLGDALWAQGGHAEDAAPLLREAANAYREALKVYSRERTPLQWADAQHRLGDVLQGLGESGKDAKLLKNAVSAYQEALRVYTREETPLRYAVAQNNLGNTLMLRGKQESAPKYFKEAAAAFRASIQALPREDDPWMWAAVNNNLGNTLFSLYETTDSREECLESVRDAVAAFRNALEIRTQERDLAVWRGTTRNLARALVGLGEQSTPRVKIDPFADTAKRSDETLGEQEAPSFPEAVALYQALFKMMPQPAGPLPADISPANQQEFFDTMRWSLLQLEMGAALQAWGRRTGGTEQFQAALVAFFRARDCWVNQRMSALWASFQENIASVLQDIGERETDSKNLENAAAVYRDAFNTYRVMGDSHGAFRAELYLADVEKLLKKRKNAGR